MIFATIPIASFVLSLVRAVSGFLFILHGLTLLFGFFGGVDNHGSPAPLASLLGVAGILESAGGLLILVGLFTRPVAFILSGQVAFAYFLSHAPKGFWPVTNGGELSVLFCFFFLYLAAAGGGAVSLDRFTRRASKQAAASTAGSVISQ